MRVVKIKSAHIWHHNVCLSQNLFSSDTLWYLGNHTTLYYTIVSDGGLVFCLKERNKSVTFGMDQCVASLIKWLLCCCRRAVDVHQPGSVVESTPVPDLLGSILSGQSMLLMDSSDVIINRDGSLKATKPGECTCWKSAHLGTFMVHFLTVNQLK